MNFTRAWIDQHGMYNQKKILAVIPARGGSKGITLKNLRKVAGKTLVGWVGHALKNTSLIDRKIVSTDHTEIAQEAKLHQLEVPFMRPEELSGDFISDLEVLTHVLVEAETFYNERYDIIVMLQPTSPARTPAQIEEVIKKLADENLDAVWTVSETDLKFHPLKQLALDSNGLMDFFLKEGKAIVARQQLTPVYHRNGIAYAFTRACLLDQKSIKGERTGVVVIEGKTPNIDSIEDLNFAEKVLTELNNPAH